MTHMLKTIGIRHETSTLTIAATDRQTTDNGGIWGIKGNKMTDFQKSL